MLIWAGLTCYKIFDSFTILHEYTLFVSKHLQCQISDSNGLCINAMVDMISSFLDAIVSIFKIFLWKFGAKL